jgi:NAD(P)-dependent dehydrogenase (short-subunit alcohol dehydrogenase family)
LYGLVNNAGIGFGNSSLQEVLEVNTYGIQRVCEAFIPLLDSSQGRIVNVTSAAGPNFVQACSPEQQKFFVDPSVTWEQLDGFMQQCLKLRPDEFETRGLGRGDPYGLSKACANVYTVMLAQRHPDLRINACTPGFIETDLTRPYAESSGRSPQDMGMKPPAAGTRAPMFLLFAELEGNGRYYGSDAQRSPLHRYRSPGDPPYEGESL